MTDWFTTTTRALSNIDGQKDREIARLTQENQRLRSTLNRLYGGIAECSVVARDIRRIARG